MGPLNVRALTVASELRRGSMAGDGKRVILICEECGERMVLGGPLSVWHSGRTFFECDCGRRLTLADRLERGKLAEAVSATNVAPPTSVLYR